MPGLDWTGCSELCKRSFGEFSGAALSPATSNIIIKNEVLFDCSFKFKSANIFFFFFFLLLFLLHFHENVSFIVE